MSKLRDYPRWQTEAIEVIRQYQDGRMKSTCLRFTFEDGSWVQSTLPARRDVRGKKFLVNMQLILLALDADMLTDESRKCVEEYFADIDSTCKTSANVETRSKHNLVAAFVRHVVDAIDAAEEAPTELIRIFGEALQVYWPYTAAGREVAENASRLTERAVMEETFKQVTKQSKTPRV